MDTKGNWSYWLETPKKRNRKIQALELEGGKDRIYDIRDFAKPEAKAEISKIKEYDKKF